MDFDEAVRVMGLSTAQDIDPGIVRKAYLRRALEVYVFPCPVQSHRRLTLSYRTHSALVPQAPGPLSDET